MFTAINVLLSVEGMGGEGKVRGDDGLAGFEGITEGKEGQVGRAEER